MIGGWLNAILNLLGMGGGGSTAPTGPRGRRYFCPGAAPRFAAAGSAVEVSPRCPGAAPRFRCNGSAVEGGDR